MKYAVTDLLQEDFEYALARVKPVSDQQSLYEYEKWKEKFANN